MRLFRDIETKWMLHAKGILFLVLGLLAGILIFIGSPDLKTAALLLATIWGFCRFYYYLFYVMEKYAGSERRYAGILDLLRHLSGRG